jgi:hypothetical protein
MSFLLKFQIIIIINKGHYCVESRVVNLVGGLGSSRSPNLLRVNPNTSHLVKRITPFNPKMTRLTRLTCLDREREREREI